MNTAMTASCYTLTRIEINADGDATAKVGSAQQTLIEQGWRVFLVRVLNTTGVAKNSIFSLNYQEQLGLRTPPLSHRRGRHVLVLKIP